MKKESNLIKQILAIVAIVLIAITVVLLTIKQSKINTAKKSASEVVKAAEDYCQAEVAENKYFGGALFVYNGNAITKTPLTAAELKFKTVTPTSGTVYINTSCVVTIENLKFGKYYANGSTKSEVVITKDAKVITNPISKEIIEDKKPGLYITGTNEYQKITVDNNEVDATWENIKLAYPDAFKTAGQILGDTYSSHMYYLNGDFVISEEIAIIGENAFADCTKLKNIFIPKSVISIGKNAFDTDTLDTIQVSLGNKNYASIDGILFNQAKTTLVRYPAGKTATTYNIPSNVTTIGDEAFASCTNLTSITISESVANISNSAFTDCMKLATIEVNSTNKNYASIDGILFNQAKTTLVRYPAGKIVTTYDIPSSVTTIGDKAFANCYDLESVLIPSSVTTIGNSAFENNSFTTIKIPSSVTSIGDKAFSTLGGLESIEVDSINKNYISVDGVLFNKDKTIIIQYPIGKTNETYQIPSSVKTIGKYAFHGCDGSMTINIPTSVTTIEAFAFEDCTGMEIRIPSSVTSIGEQAFSKANIHYTGPATGSPWGAESIN